MGNRGHSVHMGRPAKKAEEGKREIHRPSMSERWGLKEGNAIRQRGRRGQTGWGGEFPAEQKRWKKWEMRFLKKKMMTDSTGTLPSMRPQGTSPASALALLMGKRVTKDKKENLGDRLVLGLGLCPWDWQRQATSKAEKKKKGQEKNYAEGERSMGKTNWTSGNGPQGGEGWETGKQRILRSKTECQKPRY